MIEPSTNRLSSATSPYLLQHAHNPVDWYPWGPEALTKARIEDKPIFLSIGYSACHWCHVMAHESFEDEGIAQLLNAHFVPIKVDREERPDLDEIYMDAVQAITGRGGWPMSVWLMPDLKPFFGGTYFPKESRQGMPGFRSLLERIAKIWVERRPDLMRDALELSATLSRQARGFSGSSLPEDGIFEVALQQLRRDFDSQWGGFGPAPKFPAHLAVELILRRGTKDDRAMATRTLDAMEEGGMYDHLGGGFARYSVDGQWLVPHFEKMLYDNAQLASCYLSAFQATGEPRYATIARETLDYLLRDLRDPMGGFHSSEDADSEGEEGRFYVFTPSEVAESLDLEDAALFCEAFGITASGNFEHGTSVLHRFSASADLAERHGLSKEALASRIDRLRAAMLTARSRRVRPRKDDKVLAAWNGLTLSALARGYQILGDVRYLDAATACAEFIQCALWKEGTLLRVYRAGKSHTPAFLEDYGAVVRGLTDLFEAGFDSCWLRFAEALAESLLTRFEDDREGGFFFSDVMSGLCPEIASGVKGENGFHRPQVAPPFGGEENPDDFLHRRKSGWDGALPSGTTLAVAALLRLSRHLDRGDFRASAERALACCGSAITQSPRAFLGILAALDDLLRQPLEVVVVGSLQDSRTQSLLAKARRPYLPGMVLSHVDADPGLPLHQGRASMDGVPAAHLCRAMSCLPPITSPEVLETRLSEAELSS